MADDLDDLLADLDIDGLDDVDAVLTTRELARMIKQAGIDFANLEESTFDETISGINEEIQYLKGREAKKDYEQEDVDWSWGEW